MLDVIYKYLFFRSPKFNFLYFIKIYNNSNKPDIKNLVPAKKIGGAFKTPYLIAIHVVPQDKQNKINNNIFFRIYTL
jgi:hypothetical protein